MNLTPRERDKLMLSLAAMVARERLARGVLARFGTLAVRVLGGAVVLSGAVLVLA